MHGTRYNWSTIDSRFRFDSRLEFFARSASCYLLGSISCSLCLVPFYNVLKWDPKAEQDANFVCKLFGFNLSASSACGDHTVLCLSTAMLLARFSCLFLTPYMMLSVRAFIYGSKKLTHMRHGLPACAHRWQVLGQCSLLAGLSASSRIKLPSLLVTI